MTSQGLWVNQVSKIINRLRVLYICLYATPEPAFELWTFPNYTDTTDRKVSNDNIYIKEQNKE